MKTRSSGNAASTVVVSEVMTPKPVCVECGTTVRELAELFDENGISGIPVLDGQERVIGVVSKTDLVRRCLEGPQGSRGGDFSGFLALAGAPRPDMDPEDLGVVEDFMTPEPITALADEPISRVARRMAEERVHRVVVVDGNQRVIGILTALDVLDTYPEEAP
jgi:CBS domain-containing protein